MSDKPNPGSKEAIKLGCTCPVIDNRYGEGAYNDEQGNPLFWMNDDCPVHGEVSNEN